MRSPLSVAACRPRRRARKKTDMPIIGLTDRGAQFPQIGTLRKGAAKPSDRQPGRDLDHFRFEGLDPDVQAEFAAVYGPEPRQVNVYLPFATVDENFVTWKEHWVKGGLKRRCDGQTCVMTQKPDGKYDHAPHECWCARQPESTPRESLCKPTGRLKVIIPELRRFAYVVALTGSIHDIIELHANLEAIEVSAGSLRGIPLVLRRVERSISMPDDRSGQRVRRNKWLLHIEAAPRWVDLKMAALEHAALSQVSAGRALPAPTLPALPAPVLADVQTGEVIEYGDDDQAPEPAEAAPAPRAEPKDGTATISGTVEGEPVLKFNKDGVLYINLTINGQPYLIKNAAPELQYIEAGDAVTVTAHPEIVKGKQYLVVDSLAGQKDADGMTPWEERAAEAEGAAVEDEPEGEMLTADLPAHL